MQKVYEDGNLIRYADDTQVRTEYKLGGTIVTSLKHPRSSHWDKKECFLCGEWNYEKQMRKV